MTIDEVGVRFSRPFHFPVPAPPHLRDAMAAAYCRRLDAALGAADRRRAERDWRLLWLQLLFGAAGPADPLGRWTRSRPEHGCIALLTLSAASSMSALTWWGRRWAASADEDEEEEEEDEGAASLVASTPKMLVPSAVSLGAFLSTPPRPTTTACPARPAAAVAAAVVERIDGAHTNPYAQFRRAGGGQNVELKTLASYLGSSAHLVAAALALRHNPDLPTALLEVGAGGRWSALARYVARLPSVTRAAGSALTADLLDRVVAVEFPVYWCGLADEDAFVHSRIDAVTRTPDGTLAVWEFKTKWGRSSSHEERPAYADLRQVILYCYMLRLQTGIRVRRFYVRYAGIAPDGRITRTTHTFRFDPHALRGFAAHALLRTSAYADRRLATLQVDELAAALGGGGGVMPAYRLLAHVGMAAPLLEVAAAAARPQSPWLEHAGALWVAAPPTHRVFGGDNGGNNDAHRALDAAVKARGVELARNVTRCLPRLQSRLDRLYGRGSTDRAGSAVAVVIRALNRGLNALVAEGAADVPEGFVHSSRRAAWSPAAVDTALASLDTVAAQVAHEIQLVCRKPRGAGS